MTHKEFDLSMVRFKNKKQLYKAKAKYYENLCKKTRPVTVFKNHVHEAIDYVGKFHGFGSDCVESEQGTITFPVAIIEKPDGSITVPHITLIRLDDTEKTIDPIGSSSIQLSAAEIQSGLDRVKLAEGLITQLPKKHDGRNSWLLNYGIGEEANLLRENHENKTAT